MEESDLARQRLALWLRGERAFGLESVGIGKLHVMASSVTPERAAAGKAAATEAAAPARRPAPPVSPARVVTPGPQAARPVSSATSVVPLYGAIGVEPTTAMIPGLETAPFTTPVLSREEKIAALCAMDQNEVSPCNRCGLCQTRTRTVFGEGDPDAAIFFIGEGPGENEDLQGRPFVGRAGDLLNRMISGMGLKREQVFIANIVKCRPPGNRVPAPDEVATCTPYLVRQLEIVRPKVIVTLGHPSSKYMLSSKLTMGRLRGQWHTWRGIRLMPTFHPAYVLRVYTDENRAMVWSDLKKVMSEVGLAAPSKPLV